jgi:mono/diheme cytochrome c family protein
MYKEQFAWSRGLSEKDPSLKEFGNYVYPPDYPADLENPSPTAPNLYQVGSHGWFFGLLNQEAIHSPHFFGYEGSPFNDGDMATFVDDMIADDADDEQREIAQEAIDKVILWLMSEADLPATRAALETVDQTYIDEGWELINGGLAEVVDGGMSCVDCHSFEEGESLSAPNLHKYMSREWLIDFIRNPAAEHFYGELHDRMPAFAPHDDPQLNQLDEKSLGLIVDWLRGDWRRPAAAE